MHFGQYKGKFFNSVRALFLFSFETAIIERHRRRESSVEEALIEMYLAGVSVRRVEDITEALWGSGVSFLFVFCGSCLEPYFRL